MDEIFIKDLFIFCIVGVHDWERKNPRELQVDIELRTAILPATKSDEIKDTVDYEQLTQQVRSLAEKTHRFTIEALAEDIAHLCLQKSLVEKVIVTIRKPGAVTFTSSVGVRIERGK